MFLHGGWMHLIGNMWFLWVFGDNVEDVLGTASIWCFTLLCGVVAALDAVRDQSRFAGSHRWARAARSPASWAPTLIKFPHSRILTLIPIFIFCDHDRRFPPC